MKDDVKEIPVPTAILDVSITYKGVPLNGVSVEFFGGTFDTGIVPLDDGGNTSILVSVTNNDLTLRLRRSPTIPPDDPSQSPTLGCDLPFGPVTGNTQVKIVVVEPRN